MKNFQSLLSNTAEKVAPRLLGCNLRREIDGQEVVLRIVETEAYDQLDAASHSHRGRTPRTEIMFGPPGHLYVYFTYGLHYCMNIVVGPEGYGSAVLIRALEPLQGIEAIGSNRPHNSTDNNLTNGPAKLCQAIRIDKSFNGHDLIKPPLQLVVKPPLKTAQIIQTTRIGISHDTDRLWRWYIKGNPFVSKP